MLLLLVPADSWLVSVRYLALWNVESSRICTQSDSRGFTSRNQRYVINKHIYNIHMGNRSTLLALEGNELPYRAMRLKSRT